MAAAGMAIACNDGDISVVIQKEITPEQQQVLLESLRKLTGEHSALVLDTERQIYFLTSALKAREIVDGVRRIIVADTDGLKNGKANQIAQNAAIDAVHRKYPFKPGHNGYNIEDDMQAEEEDQQDDVKALMQTINQAPAFTRIRRPRNMWILYRQAKSSEVRSLYPDITAADISRVLSRAWAQESPEVKRHYRMLAEQEAAGHRAMHPNYVYTPGRVAKRHRRRLRQQQLVQLDTPVDFPSVQEALDD